MIEPMRFESLEKSIIAGACLTNVYEFVVGVQRIDSSLVSEIH